MSEFWSFVFMLFGVIALVLSVLFFIVVIAYGISVTLREWADKRATDDNFCEICEYDIHTCVYCGDRVKHEQDQLCANCRLDMEFER